MRTDRGRGGAERAGNDQRAGSQAGAPPKQTGKNA
jgi:hypothetical protein